MPALKKKREITVVISILAIAMLMMVSLLLLTNQIQF